MGKEPYNLFSDAGSTIPGGTAYEDLLVIIKGMIHMNGGQIDVPEDFLMWVDRDESIRMDDVYKDGMNHKIFTIESKMPNQNPEGHIRHEVEEKEVNPPLWAKAAAAVLWFFILFALIFLLAQLVRWVI